MKKYILYNPIAGNERGDGVAKKLGSLYIGYDVEYLDILKIENFENFFSSIDTEDDVIICGGDGTLNRFINRINGIGVKNRIFYYSAGSGNDFLNDLEKPFGSEPFLINDYMNNLPIVDIGGVSFRFFNGIGFGLEGTVCAVGNRMRETSKKKIDYTSIAIKQILFSFRPRTAKITVDGETFEHKKVWLASAMHGRYFGGGMKVAPNQKRGSDELSLVVVHDCNKLQLMSVFPSVFKGDHLKFKKLVSVYTGKEITVEYDVPCELQLDGETVLDVTSYTARSKAAEKITAEI